MQREETELSGGRAFMPRSLACGVEEELIQVERPPPHFPPHIKDFKLKAGEEIYEANHMRYTTVQIHASPCQVSGNAGVLLALEGLAYLECRGYLWCLEARSVHVNQEAQSILRKEKVRNGSSHCE
jgi:hypothetical protein